MLVTAVCVFFLIKLIWPKKGIFTIHFKFDLDRKLNLWIKLEPYFLKRLPNGKIENGKIEKTTVYLPTFFLFVKFSAIETRVLFSRKAYDKLITMTSSEKMVGCHAHCWAIASFQMTELNIKANLPCFQYARTRGRAKWHHKFGAERMSNANVRNHLNGFSENQWTFWEYSIHISIVVD